MTINITKNNKVGFQIYSLGCKVNQYDSAVLRRELESGNYVISNQPQLVIINTCTVTKNAITKDRQLTNKLRREFPAALLIVMGCWVQTDDQIIKIFPAENILFWGVGKSAELIHKINEYFSAVNYILDLAPWESGLTGGSLLAPIDHSRYFLKVGDGCNQFCSYCLIPYARGPITSRPLKDLVEEVRQAISAGYGEIVLSGIHLGRYGQDLKHGESFNKLLTKLIAIPGLGRLRLSSIEINEVDDDLINLMNNNEKICQHLHISLQSGCDKILKLMKRPYNKTYFKKRVNKLRTILPNIAISTDIIVGFPGENEKDYLETCRFAEEINFSMIHVFSYSAHEKTAAYNLPDKVSADKIKQRSENLRQISAKLEKDYKEKIIKRLKGQKIKVIIERVRGAKNKGKTEFYFDIAINNKGKIGSLIELNI
jgi:threonylcarbamoyladenosine tRNA methylthiotransferase MtaB